MPKVTGTNRYCESILATKKHATNVDWVEDRGARSGDPIVAAVLRGKILG